MTAMNGTTPRTRALAFGAAAVVLTMAVAHGTGRSSAAAVPAQPRPVPTPAVAYVGGDPAEPENTEAHGPDAATGEAPSQRFTGRVGNDLSAAMRAAGVPDAQGREYVAVLARAIPLARELSVEDRFDLVLERREDGTLGQLVYAGLDRVARADVELMKWTDGQSIIWVNGDGVGGEGEQGIGRPVDGRVTSGFGTRFHPVLGYARMHKGVDLAAAYGSPITAAADGKVVSAGWAGGYGKQVAIAHADGVRTSYGHMSRIVAAAGAFVRRGQVIGYVGSTGLSTGPHVHFEVTRNGRPVNPLSAKLAGGPGVLQGAQLKAFQGQLRQVLLTPARG